MTWYLYHIFFQIHIQSERRKSGLSTYLWDQEGQGEQGPHKDHDESLGEGSTQGKAEEGGHLISRPKVGGTTSSCHTLQLQDVTSFDSLTVASALEASSDSLTVTTAQEDSLDFYTEEESFVDSLTEGLVKADDNSTEIQNNVSDDIELDKTFSKYIDHKEAISSSTEEAVISSSTEEAVISSCTEEAVGSCFIDEKEASESSQLFSDENSFPVESVR